MEVEEGEGEVGQVLLPPSFEAEEERDGDGGEEGVGWR